MSFIMLFAFQLAQPCSAEDTSAGGQALSVERMVKRINERHDDFFRYHRELEERWEKRRGTIGERKKLEAIHAEKVEHAREEYVKSKASRVRPTDEASRLRHEAAEKDRLAQNEMLRLRYVKQRDTVEQYLKKGRAIPELKEFDLEGY